MKKQKNSAPILWLMGMSLPEKITVEKIIETFKKSGYKFATVDYDFSKNSFRFISYNMAKSEDTPLIDEVYSYLEKYGKITLEYV